LKKWDEENEKLLQYVKKNNHKNKQ